MSFSNPWLLLLLLPLFFWVVAVWRHHGQPVSVPFDHAVPGKLRWTTRLLRLAGLLPVLLLVLVVFILAGPRRLGEPQTRRMLTNIEFVVDVSGSMTAPFGPDGDRYDAAMRSILEFVDKRKGDAFGLMVFGDSLLEWVPLTSDPSALKAAPPFLSPRNLPAWFSGGTSIGKALEHALKVVSERPEGDRMIVLLTDGMSGDIMGGQDAVIAGKLKDANIQVFCIHIDESDPPEEVTNIARLTGGAIFGVNDPTSLVQVFKRIDEMKKARLERVTAENMDHYEPWTLVTGIFLFGLTITLCGFRPTPW